jgi:hypothetical protein
VSICDNGLEVAAQSRKRRRASRQVQRKYREPSQSVTGRSARIRCVYPIATRFFLHARAVQSGATRRKRRAFFLACCWRKLRARIVRETSAAFFAPGAARDAPRITIRRTGRRAGRTRAAHRRCARAPHGSGASTAPIARARRHVWKSWMRLPHVSSNTAIFTGPCCFGGARKTTPRADMRAYSASMSSQAKAVHGTPSS